MSCALIVGALTCDEALARGSSERGCVRTLEVDDFPLVSGGVQTAQGEILLTAYLDGQILRLSPQGEVLERHRHRAVDPLGVGRPSVIRSAEGGFAVQDSMSGWAWTDGNLVPQAGVHFPQSSSSTGLQPPLVQLAVWDFYPAGRDIFVFGYIRREGEAHAERYFALVTVVDSRVAPKKVIEKVDAYAPSSRFYGMSLPLLAAAGGGVFGLRFDQTHSILRLDQPELSPQSFPAGFRKTAVLPESPGSPEGSRLGAEAIEAMTLPRALYGRGKFLYLLTRSPERGGTAWHLHQIDPFADRLVRTVRLPSSAQGLILVPGPEHWILLEQGGMGEYGRPIIGWVNLPSEWIEDSASMVLTGEQPIQCAPSQVR